MKRIISLIIMLALLSISCMAIADDAITATTVYADPDSPTGYTVAFRYPNADLTRVRLVGEWGFSDFAHASAATSLHAPAEAWQDGYFNLYYNGGSYYELALNADTNTWEIDVPLPNGTWSYYFMIGGEGDLRDTGDASIAYDPGNIPQCDDISHPFEIKEDWTSGIYVPFDGDKQSDEYPEQAPRTDGQIGTIEYATVNDVTFAIYLPYGYDAHREEKYPLITLIPGGGGNEDSWFNKGAADHILDNMIAEGRTKPAVMISMDISALGTYGVSGYVVEHAIPYMVENYNVSDSYLDHAVSGLSMGGHATSMCLAEHYDVFKYIGVLSNGASPVRKEGYDFTGIKEYETTLFLGAGMYDYAYLGKNTLTPRSEAHSSLVDNINVLHHCLAENDIPFTTMLVPGGHSWSVWQVILVHMLENVFWQ